MPLNFLTTRSNAPRSTTTVLIHTLFHSKRDKIYEQLEERKARKKLRTRMKWNLRLPKSIIERKTFFYSLSHTSSLLHENFIFISFMLIQLLLAGKKKEWVCFELKTCWHDFYSYTLCIRCASYFSSTFCMCVNVCILVFFRCVFDYVKNAEMR